MLRKQEHDRRAFVDAARKHGGEVRVYANTQVMPRAQGNAVVMQRVILLRYVLDFKEEGRDEGRVFEELVDDKGGQLDISGSLLDDLYRDEKIIVKVSDHTMTLPPAMDYKRTLLRALRERPGSPFTATTYYNLHRAELHALGLRIEDIQFLLDRLVAEGQVERAQPDVNGVATYACRREGAAGQG
jgi:hypothetical protein